MKCPEPRISSSATRSPQQHFSCVLSSMLRSPLMYHRTYSHTSPRLLFTTHAHPQLLPLSSPRPRSTLPPTPLPRSASAHTPCLHPSIVYTFLPLALTILHPPSPFNSTLFFVTPVFQPQFIMDRSSSLPLRARLPHCLTLSAPHFQDSSSPRDAISRTERLVPHLPVAPRKRCSFAFSAKRSRLVTRYRRAFEIGAQKMPYLHACISCPGRGYLQPRRLYTKCYLQIRPRATTRSRVPFSSTSRLRRCGKRLWDRRDMDREKLSCFRHSPSHPSDACCYPCRPYESCSAYSELLSVTCKERKQRNVFEICPKAEHANYFYVPCPVKKCGFPNVFNPRSSFLRRQHIHHHSRATV